MIRGFVIGVTVAAGALLSPAASFATERGVHAGWHVRQPVRFMVSGVLQRIGSPDVIKPIHSIITADDGDIAIARFARTAQQQYPGYTLVASLASPVPEVGTCESNI